MNLNVESLKERLTRQLGDRIECLKEDLEELWDSLSVERLFYGKQKKSNQDKAATVIKEERIPFKTFDELIRHLYEATRVQVNK